MKSAWILVLMMGCSLGVVGCGSKKDAAAGEKAAGTEPAGKTSPGVSSGNPLTAPVDYLGAVGAAQKQAARVADLTPVQLAVRAFQAGEDRMPSNLQEIVTEGYLPKLPTPPRGMVLAYNPGTGQVKFMPAPAP